MGNDKEQKKAWDSHLFRVQIVPDTPPRPQSAIEADIAENMRYKRGEYKIENTPWYRRYQKKKPKDAE